jgi:hypothetical protein
MNMKAAGFSQTSVFTKLYGVILQTIASLVSDTVRWAVHTARAGQKSNTKLWSENGKEKNHFGKLDVEGRTTLKWTL